MKNKFEKPEVSEEHPFGEPRGNIYPEDEGHRIKTRLNPLKRDSGLFTIAAIKDLKKMAVGKTICDMCGSFEECDYRKRMVELSEEMSEQNIFPAPIISCSKFMPPLVFKDLTGTGRVEWCTFRFGPAWANRIRQGETIALVNKKNLKFGEAVVRHIRIHNRETALSRYSAQHHLLIDRNLKPERAASIMRKRLVEVMGNKVALVNGKFTVLELTRVK